MRHEFRKQLLILMVLMAFVPATSAEQPRRFEPTCGVEAVYAAAHIHGRKFDFGLLLRPEYIGTQQGSSASELVRAAGDIGLHAVVIGGMNAVDLRQQVDPVILHVRAQPMATRPTHWVLYVGERDGRPLIIDGDADTSGWTWGDMTRLWPGHGIIVSDAPISAWSAGSATAALYLSGVGILLGGAWLAGPKLVKLEVVRWSRQFTVAVGLVIVAGVAGLIWHWMIAGGYFHDTHATVAHAEALTAWELERIGFDEAWQAYESDVVMLDARPVAQVAETGTIPGAGMLPHDLPERQWAELIEKLDLQEQVVVFCGNDRCGYARSTAQRLRSSGFSHVVVYDGGLMDWVGRQPGREP